MILACAGPKTIDYDVFVAGQPTTKWMRTATNKLKLPPYTAPGKRPILKPANAAELITEKLSVTAAFCHAKDPNLKYPSAKPIFDRELEKQLNKEMTLRKMDQEEAEKAKSKGDKIFTHKFKGKSIISQNRTLLI